MLKRVLEQESYMNWFTFVSCPPALKKINFVFYASGVEGKTRKASRQFGIPRTILRRKIKLTETENQSVYEAARVYAGRKPALSKDIESEVIKILHFHSYNWVLRVVILPFMFQAKQKNNHCSGPISRHSSDTERTGLSLPTPFGWGKISLGWIKFVSWGV